MALLVDKDCGVGGQRTGCGSALWIFWGCHNKNWADMGGHKRHGTKREGQRRRTDSNVMERRLPDSTSHDRYRPGLLFTHTHSAQLPPVFQLEQCAPGSHSSRPISRQIVHLWGSAGYCPPSETGVCNLATRAPGSASRRRLAWPVLPRHTHKREMHPFFSSVLLPDFQSRFPPRDGRRKGRGVL